jgi:hypothetical protein
MSTVVVTSSVRLIPVLFLVCIYGLPLWAIVSVCRFLRGGLRIFWVVLIVGGFLFIPLIGLILSVMWFVFKSRFVDWQR